MSERELHTVHPYWGEGDAPKKDVQYAIPAQTFSTNPSDDWKTFFHNFKDMKGYTDAFPDEQPFAIALRNHGPPYEVVMRGVSATMELVYVCMKVMDPTERSVVSQEPQNKKSLDD